MKADRRAIREVFRAVARPCHRVPTLRRASSPRVRG